MFQISQDIINKIKDNSNIVSVIGKSLKLTKHGVNHIGVCPFHADRTPSLTVNQAKGFYKCFACGAAGDVIKFVQEHERVSFVEAVKMLAKDCHVDIPEVKLTPEELAKEKQRESVYIVLNEVKKQFQLNLNSFEPASNYIRIVRQISEEMIELYGIGYAQNDNQILREFQKKTFSADTLLAADVVRFSDEHKSYYDTFRSRITFPYFDLHGRPVGFTGRVTDNNAKAAKYLNSSDTVAFNKGSVLYGMYQAKEAIIQAGRAYLSEGQTDVISVAQRGVRNIIAGSGTALTDTQARLLKRFTNTVVLLYDSDVAGLKASIANAKVLLAHSFDVRAVQLPEGQDPDDFCKSTKTEDLGILLKNREVSFIKYFYDAKKVAEASDFENVQLLDMVCECISVVPDKYLREKYTISLSEIFNTNISIITDKVKPVREMKTKSWENGFYGLDEAKELMEEYEQQECWLVFKEEDFMKSFSEEPTVLAIGSPTLPDIQKLRQVANKLNVLPKERLVSKDLIESKELLLLKNMHKNGMEITVENGISSVNFCDYYIDVYSTILKGTFNESEAEEGITDSTKRAEIIGRCAEVISQLEATTRAVMNDVYAKKLGMKLNAFEKVLKPFLAKKKDKAMIDNQRLGELTDAFVNGTEEIPEYVEKDPVLFKTYMNWGFYPLADKTGRYFSYMFKNQTGGSHSSVSDFYIKPLLHIYDESNDNSNNKRVVQLCHMDKRLDKYVEWKSNIFAVMPKVHEQLVNAGPYNFFGTVDQYKRIWMNMSYGFTKCYPINVLGQHTDGFFVFGNAIFHKVEGKFQIDYVDDLGVVTHEETNYYLPAFSKIHLDRKNDQDKNRYKLARNFMYKEIPADKQVSFEKWADLMNRVYSVNDNGKWAILYAITCGFRDYIFESRGEFTAPFFIGPTSSGKSKIAESIRNLYMDYKSAAFNLNTGTPAAFFMFVESLRNLPIVMEEYNDNDINPMIFQALKAATLDGQGRIKVADAASKTMDSSEINASLILLGQEAPQKDDGSLANRCIICDVPARDFTEEETEIYSELKEYEKNGLSNLLLQVLELREIYEKYFIEILISESKKLKDSIKLNVTNTEGLARIINACALMTSTCFLLEKHAPHMKLPFTYDEFFPIAERKVFSQVERISSTNKLSTYFQSISTLITQERIKIGRELKVSSASKVTRLLSGKKREEVDLPIDTKVLYIDFEGVYSLYQKEVGSNEALSRQSLTAYFHSNQAFIGLCNSTRFKWTVPEQVAAAVTTEVAPDGENVTTSNNARMKMVEKTKTNSAYMFNYNILKTLVDIDYERLEEEKTNEVKPTDGDLPF